MENSKLFSHKSELSPKEKGLQNRFEMTMSDVNNLIKQLTKFWIPQVQESRQELAHEIIGEIETTKRACLAFIEAVNNERDVEESAAEVRAFANHTKERIRSIALTDNERSQAAKAFNLDEIMERVKGTMQSVLDYIQGKHNETIFQDLPVS